jgi:hypothetical protein
MLDLQNKIFEENSLVSDEIYVNFDVNKIFIYIPNYQLYECTKFRSTENNNSSAASTIFS